MGDSLIDDVLAALERHPGGMTVFQLADLPQFAGHCSWGDIDEQLYLLAKRGKAIHDPGGVWVWKATGHGGKREGAGRKPSNAGEMKIKVSVAIRPGTLAALEAHALPDEPLGQTIDRVVEGAGT